MEFYEIVYGFDMPLQNAQCSLSVYGIVVEIFGKLFFDRNENPFRTIFHMSCNTVCESVGKIGYFSLDYRTFVCI